MPGKRVEAFVIDQIDPVCCVGFKNICVHCGINDIKNSRNDVNTCFNKLIDKVETIQALCPTSRITISPILPTRSWSLNNRAIRFNNMLFEYSTNKNSGFGTLNFNCFCDSNGQLLDSMARYEQPENILHLGSTGIFTLSRLIKSKIFGHFTDGRRYSAVAGLSVTNVAIPKHSIYDDG